MLSTFASTFSARVDVSDSATVFLFTGSLLGEQAISKVDDINNIYEAATFANHEIQTIGLALTPKRKYHFAEIASKNGACRFPDIGRMTHFDSPWDGMFLINRLIKFISLDGPFN